MRNGDYPDFVAVLEDLAGTLPRPGQGPLTQGVCKLYFSALRPYSLPQVLDACTRHMADTGGTPPRGRFFPTPADLLRFLLPEGSGDGRLDAAEAWSLAVRAADEGETVIWTEETAAAWEQARPIYKRDGVGARMAFVAAYDRLVAAARAEGRPPVWLDSIGHDPERRAAAIQRAVHAGQLPATHPLAQLPPPEPRRMLAGPAVRAAPPEWLRERLAAVRAELTAGKAEPSPAERARAAEAESLRATDEANARELAARDRAAHPAAGRRRKDVSDAARN